ncbi:MAG: hypothetical protein FWE74_11055 [Oscillospiraceae bacterium]|jgi:hypothetical protein|nr:hypothetical protein [Oscillospiraceae bacterium]
MDNKKFLHGNRARINPEQTIIPRFTNYVASNYETSDGTVSYGTPYDDAEFNRAEVSDNKK